MIVQKVVEAEVDEMWSFVGTKATPRWLWHALDHQTGKVLAYVFGRRNDNALLALKALLEPFGITRFYTDGWARTSAISIPHIMKLASAIPSSWNASI